MKLSRFNTFFILCSTVNPSFIPVKRICKDCKYFIGDTLQCRKFGDTNIVTGEVTYPYASVIRGDSKKCGEVGNHFENNPYKLVTGPYYFVKKNLFLTFSGVIIGINVVSIIIQVISKIP
uniref:Uncharacterized protein n=1 Tax=viral metagenome TaxID=1070528 RepID=A0A6C0D238_9ZZZZ